LRASDEQSVAGGLDDAASVFGYFRIDKAFSESLQPGQRAFFVASHEAAITGDICRQNRNQSPHHAHFGQNRPQDSLICPWFIKA
jgi:hypothetical protein